MAAVALIGETPVSTVAAELFSFQPYCFDISLLMPFISGVSYMRAQSLIPPRTAFCRFMQIGMRAASIGSPASRDDLFSIDDMPCFREELITAILGADERDNLTSFFTASRRIDAHDASSRYAGRLRTAREYSPFHDIPSLLLFL